MSSPTPTNVATPVPTPPKVPYDYFGLIYWIVLLIIPLVAFWMAHKPASITIPILRHDMPAYHVIEANDIVSKKVLSSELTPDIVRDESSILEHYTREAIQAGQAIRRNQIGAVLEQRWILNTVAVSIPATRLTIPGDSLRAGDIVNVSTVPGSAEKPQVILDAVLVLDINSSGDDQMIVLAIPQAHWEEYLTKTHNSPLILARRMVGQKID